LELSPYLLGDVRVAGVEDQLVDRPDLDLKRGGRGHHAPYIAVIESSSQQLGKNQQSSIPLGEDSDVGAIIVTTISQRLYRRTSYRRI
jgi:hypothetical protein